MRKIAVHLSGVMSTFHLSQKQEVGLLFQKMTIRLFEARPICLLLRLTALQMAACLILSFERFLKRKGGTIENLCSSQPSEAQTNESVCHQMEA